MNLGCKCLVGLLEFLPISFSCSKGNTFLWLPLSVQPVASERGRVACKPLGFQINLLQHIYTSCISITPQIAQTDNANIYTSGGKKLQRAIKSSWKQLKFERRSVELMIWGKKAGSLRLVPSDGSEVSIRVFISFSFIKYDDKSINSPYDGSDSPSLWLFLPPYTDGVWWSSKKKLGWPTLKHVTVMVHQWPSSFLFFTKAVQRSPAQCESQRAFGLDLMWDYWHYGISQGK